MGRSGLGCGRRPLGDLPTIAQANATDSALTPPWYYFLFPPAGGVWLANQLYNLPIPGSTPNDIVTNAGTGRPTAAQVAANIPVDTSSPLYPQYAADQSAYTKLIGGTANDAIASVLPNSTNWVLWAVAGVGTLALLGYLKS